MTEPPAPVDVPVEGPDVPEVEDVPPGYLPPGEQRDYPRAGDTTDPGGDDRWAT